jgi:hypothetical protein
MFACCYSERWKGVIHEQIKMCGRKNDLEDPWIHFAALCIVFRFGGQHCFTRGGDVFCIAFDHIECFIHHSAEKQDVPTALAVNHLQQPDADNVESDRSALIDAIYQY